jgi:hypothetical protein
MPKLLRGRLDGLHGMRSFTSEELFAFAARLEQQAAAPDCADDPRWLRRWATRVRRLAELKEDACVSRSRDHRDDHRRRQD